jgi:hypothetical protein
MPVQPLLLVCTVLLAIVSFVRADPPVHDTALFIQNALASEAPIGYWDGDAVHPPTFFFYMRHEQWQAGTDLLRRDGAMLLGCVAPVLGARFGLGAFHLSARNRASYHYQIKVVSPPPGGITTLVAEGRVDAGECAPSRDAQKQFLDILVPEEHRQL